MGGKAVAARRLRNELVANALPLAFAKQYLVLCLEARNPFAENSALEYSLTAQRYFRQDREFRGNDQNSNAWLQSQSV